MRYLIALSAIMFGSISFCFADTPSKDPLSDVNYSNLRSSSIYNGGGHANVQLSSGVIRLDYVFVSSPGINSMLVLQDRNMTASGNLTKDINGNGDLTNTYGEIPYHIETSTQGLVYTTTCSACSSLWTAPRVRFGYERKR